MPALTGLLRGILRLPQPHQRGTVIVGDIVVLLDQLHQGLHRVLDALMGSGLILDHERLPWGRQDGRNGIEGRRCPEDVSVGTTRFTPACCAASSVELAVIEAVPAPRSAATLSIGPSSRPEANPRAIAMIKFPCPTTRRAGAACAGSAGVTCTG